MMPRKICALIVYIKGDNTNFTKYDMKVTVIVPDFVLCIMLFSELIGPRYS